MDGLESLLRQFQPRRPGPLPPVERGRGVRPLARVVLAGIAAVVVTLIGWRTRITVSDAPANAVTLGALTPYAIDESRDLESILMRTSRALLPDVECSSGVLHALAKE
jgi:hypothetical protein